MGTLAAESLSEKIDDRLRRVAKFNERICENAARESRSIAENYLRGEYVFIARRAGRNPCQYGLVFQCRDSIGKLKLQTPSTDVPSFDDWLRFHEFPMLSHNVQLMEPEKGVGSFRIVPSMVWLEIFDGRLVEVGKPLYFFQSAVAPRLHRGTDGEIDIFGTYMAVARGQCGGKQIQAASGAIDNGASFGIDDEGEWINLPNLKRILSSLRIVFSENGVWARFEPSDDALSEDFDLGFGPVYGGLGI